MTPNITPASLRELADSHDPYWRADTRHALRAAADRLEAYECLQVSTRKELDAAKAAHAEEAGRWDEQHSHQHAVNTRLARRNALLEHAFAAAKELQFDYDPEYGASHAIIENFLKALEDCDSEKAE